MDYPLQQTGTNRSSKVGRVGGFDVHDNLIPRRLTLSTI